MNQESQWQRYNAGFEHGFTHGRFANNNPYRPGSDLSQDWEDGFKAGVVQRDWFMGDE